METHLGIGGADAELHPIMMDHQNIPYNGTFQYLLFYPAT
jgi:hypothetical protein